MAGVRDTILSALDNIAFYESRVGQTKAISGSERRFACPFHDDTDPSANFNTDTGTWYCHVCNIGGSPIDFLMRRENLSYRDALTRLSDEAGVPLPGPEQKAPKTRRRTSRKKLSEENVQGWHEAAMRNTDLMAWFHDKRGFTTDTVARWQLGWDGERVTIPVRDEKGVLVNVRRYLRNARGEQGKMLSLEQGTGAARLWPADALGSENVILVEGEWDAILMHQQGFGNALTVTSGAGIFKPEWSPLFADKHVYICYDNDEAGRKGANRVAGILSAVATPYVVNISGLPPKGDVTDFFVEQNRDADELRLALDDALPFAPATSEPEQDPVEIPLGEASDARHRDVLQAIPVMVSGKAVTPYTVPKEFTVKCDMGNAKYCAVCPLAEYQGVRRVTLDAKDPKALQLINVTDNQQYKALTQLAEAVSQCSRPNIEVHESANIEELRLIPELDTDNSAGDVEYVSRTGFLLGHGLRTNRSYRVIGYAHPHPKTQATVHLLREAIPSQDNISAFELTDEVRAQLQVFDAGDDVEAKLRDVYDDFRLNVHRIQGRFEMQVAFDLVWHSAIAFYFNGSFVRRGWTECMVIGDSGQGKTEMAMALLNHYRMGERVQAEQATMAGLLGGLEKLGDTWILSWGKLALNDKRLLVVDETQGLQSNQIEALSDVRATGVAEITKIRTERTNARCRIIWLANPSTGRPLAQYNQGVLAVKDVFHKPEDVRRLDFAIATASGDVALDDINALHGEPVAPRYSSEACRNLVLWAWSRTPDQVRFTPEATQAILSAAMTLGKQYHPSIPLVEPADERLKVARLAAAVAARVYSTDAAGDVLLVRPEHVAFVSSYLQRIYEAASMSYGEYSRQQQAGERLDPEERTLAMRFLMDLPNAEAALDFLRQAKVFRATEVEDVVGWDTEERKDAIKKMAKHRLIRSTRDGYVKQPVFIELLRSMRTDDIAAPMSAEEMADLEVPWES